MSKNPIQFAVVREDPRVESRVIEQMGAKRVLMEASGGCTALSLATLHPQLQLTLVDPNPAQLDLIRRKQRALAAHDASERNRLFNIGSDDSAGLNQCGNFESLFRSWRRFIHELIAPPAAVEALFTQEGELASAPSLLFESPWWPVPFRLFFSDDVLRTMFGPDATQHATPGSYPAYFQELFERGLRRADAFNNYFLHHILLGKYLDRPAALPAYLVEAPSSQPIELATCTLADAPDPESADLVGLWNLMDWMDADAIRCLAERLGDALRPGAAIVYRQLNNDDDLEALFRPQFRFDQECGAALLAEDRSLFYQSIHVGIRT